MKSRENVLNSWENAVLLQMRNKYKYMEYDFEDKEKSSQWLHRGYILRMTDDSFKKASVGEKKE